MRSLSNARKDVKSERTFNEQNEESVPKSSKNKSSTSRLKLSMRLKYAIPHPSKIVNLVDEDSSDSEKHIHSSRLSNSVLPRKF